MESFITGLILSADEVLTTTHAVRKRLDFDRDISSSVIEECLQIALQAPSGSNAQGWHFVLVTDAQKRLPLPNITSPHSLNMRKVSISLRNYTAMAYTRGTDFKEAPRKPLDGVMHRDRW